VATDPILFKDKSGQIHAVWNTFNKEGIGISGHYARLDITNKQWSKPIEIDEGGIGLGIKYVRLAEHVSDLILAYYGGGDNANYWRRSSDGGITWSSPVKISSRHKGTNGPVSFVVDSDNVLHAFFGQRIDDNNHGMWHTIWTGAGWTESQPVVRGAQVRDKIGGDGFDPQWARAVVSNGNLILVSWGTDAQGSPNGAWYSYTTLDTPELPEVPLPIPTISPTKTPIPTATSAAPTVTPSPTRPVFSDNQNDNLDGVISNPAGPLVFGVIPVVILLLAVIIIHQFYHAAARH
jgi:hypothetical protein